MTRLIAALMLLALLTGAFVTGARAEMMRPDLGSGLTDHLSARMMTPPSAPEGIMVEPAILPPEPAKLFMPMLPIEDHLARMRAERVRGFWTYMALLSAVFLGGSWVLGRQVIRRGWKVGYTRKANALMLYFLPYVALQHPSPYGPIMTATITLGVFALLLGMLARPIRSRVPVLATAFASIDRPEDRPFTLAWLTSSVAAVWGIVVLWFWAAPETAHYAFVAFFISGVGDALAEPVGLALGRHPYRTRALWTDRTYIRTLEGSAVVFASGVVAVLLMHGVDLGVEGWIALAAFPLVGTLAEARAPHTWDQPFIVGCSALVAVGLSWV